MLEIIFDNWKYIVSLLALLLFASMIYMRIIKNNEIFEEFQCQNQLGMLPPANPDCHSIPVVINGTQGELRGSHFNMSNEINDMNSQRPKCSNFVVNSPPISSMFNITDMCHTNNKREQLEWDCFYRYKLQKNLLKDPNWGRNIFKKNYPIFYRI